MRFISFMKAEIVVICDCFCCCTKCCIGVWLGRYLALIIRSLKPSARVIAASFPLGNIKPYNKSCTVTLWFSVKSADVPMVLAARAETRNQVFFISIFNSLESFNVTIMVIILVKEAISLVSSAFLLNRTLFRFGSMITYV